MGISQLKSILISWKKKSIKSKDARIKYNKIDQYIGILMEHGTAVGEPYVKHLDGEIWELRPLRDRILFFAWDGNSFILLSHFMKSTQKTPKRECEKAKRLMEDFRERSREDG